MSHDISKLRPACDCIEPENLIKTPTDSEMFIKCGTCGTQSAEPIKLPIPVTELCTLIDRINSNEETACTRDGHDWKQEGGRHCVWCYQGDESMPVFVCSRCGETDYGDREGVGFKHCKENCKGFTGYIGK